MNQRDIPNGRSQGLALSAFSSEWGKKPAGQVVGTASTYAEAQRIYNAAKAANNGSAVFGR